MNFAQLQFIRIKLHTKMEPKLANIEQGEREKLAN